MDDRELLQATALHAESVPLSVGRATIAWNTLSGSMYDFFSLLSEMEDATAKAVFFTVNSDRSQRDMVSALVESRLKPKHPKLAKKAQSIIGEVNKLSGRRNDILHVVFEDSLSPSNVSQLHERGHLKGKRGTHLTNAIMQFAIDALDLALNATKLRGEIWELPEYQRKTLAEAVLRYSAQRTPEELANQGLFGLLNVPATNPQSPSETQPNEETQ